MLPDSFVEQARIAAGLDPTAITRLAGTESADVAPLLSETLASVDTSVTAVFANGARTSDALAAAMVAAYRPGAALVLTRADGSLPPEASAYLARHASDIAATLTVGPVSSTALVGLPGPTPVGTSDSGQTQIAAIGRSRATGSVRLFAYNPDSAADGVVATASAVRTQSVTMPIFRGRVFSPFEREWVENQAWRVQSVTMVGDGSTLPPVADAMIDKARR
jgi:hypothetical protein